MAVAVLIVLNLVLIFEETFAVPDYKKLHENLSLRENSEKEKSKILRHQDGTLLTAEVGKVFKYSLQDFILDGQGNTPTSVHIYEHGKTGLPRWLSYNEKKRKLVGVPTRADVGRIKIVLKTGTKNHKKKFKFEVNVKDARDTFVCHHGNPAFVAAALLSIDFQSFNGLARVKLLRKFADYVDIGLHEVIVEEKKPSNVLDFTMETAGPGDGIITKAPGLIVKWKVNCKLGVAGDRSVNLLKMSSGNKRIFNSTGVPFLGWYVYRHQKRYRRQAARGTTPLATPAATPSATKPVAVVTSMISGTPVISATPTLVIKSTSTVAVTPTKTSAVPVKPTPTVTSQPPTTEAEATTKLTTTTQPPTTTEEATTKKIIVTTKEEKTTMKPKTTTMKPETTTMEPETTTMKPETTTMKPETTTMKPETTTMKPVTTREKPDTTTSPPDTTMARKTTKMVPRTTPPVIKNLAPVLKNSIDLIQVNAGQAFKVKIENDVFEDDNDGNTYNLLLALKRNVLQKLKDVDESQIFLDTKNFYLYGLPTLADVGDNSYALQATDSFGKQTNAVFTVRVLDENVVYNDVFNVSVDLDFAKFVKSAKNKVKLVEKIAETTDVGFKTIRLQKFYPGSVVMSYSSSEFQTGDCNSVKAQAYKAKLEGSAFLDAMAPDYIVLGTSAKKAGTNCGGVNRRKSPRKSGDGGYKWWEVVLIPVIVIAVLLLVIGLIFFFLYRRKRRYEPQKEDKNTFLYQKKPVIFREEYEDKPDLVSLEPLFLPNERAPLTNTAYQPRTSTPDENGSSSASTEDEEKALVENKTPQTPPPQTPPPRSPPYGRSPPPYTEP
eukprot:gene496-10175_t